MIAIVGGKQDTRSNKEDFAITPFIFGVLPKLNTFKIYGIGFCWGWFAVHIGIAFNAPKELGRFIWIKQK